MQIVSARISAIIHATEDPEKVVHAIGQACSSELVQSKLDTKKLKGHYGNEITTVTLRLRGRPAESFLNHLWKTLQRHDREMLLSDLDACLDEEARLHIRLDKAEFFRGVWRLKDQDPIKIQVSFQDTSDHGLRVAEQVRKFLEALQNRPESLVNADTPRTDDIRVRLKSGPGDEEASPSLT